MTKEISLLHLYSQEHEHGEVFVVGNRAGLSALKKSIDRAMETGAGESTTYCQDGEGFDIHTVLMEEADPRWEWIREPYTGERAPREGMIEPEDLLGEGRG